MDKTHEGRLHEAQNITDLAQATIYAMDRDSAIGKGRLRRLFLNGPAHCTQVIAKAQGRRLLALCKVGAELQLTAH